MGLAWNEVRTTLIIPCVPLTSFNQRVIQRVLEMLRLRSRIMISVHREIAILRLDP
jgi:hypothetical protein